MNVTALTLGSVCKSGLVLATLLVVGCAASQSATYRRLAQTAAQLQRQSDADSLAAAGLFSVLKSRPQAVALIARAETAAPERADIVWLHIQMCHDEPTCDPQPEERRLRSLSPDNGAGWLGALARAVTAKDEAAQDAALTAIGNTARVDIYWTALIGHLSAAAARMGKLSAGEAMISVVGIVDAVAMPAFGAASNSCKGDRLQRSDIREACRGVATAFEQGDAVITEMMGVAIAKRVWPAGSPQWKSAAERRRVYDYRSALWQTVESPLRNSPAHRYIAMCLEQHREQDVMRLQLVNAGKPPDPPPLLDAGLTN